MVLSAPSKQNLAPSTRIAAERHWGLQPPGSAVDLQLHQLGGDSSAADRLPSHGHRQVEASRAGAAGLDVDHRPTLPSPIRPTLGAAQFLTQVQALAEAEQHAGGSFSLLSSDLKSEAAARRRAHACMTFQGHTDGVWVLAV